MRKETTKVCKCGNTYLALLSSLNKKYCPECHTYIDWYLDQGQKSPLTSHIGGLVDSPIQVNTNTHSLENNMLPNQYFIPLQNTNEQQIASFCEAFTTVHNLQEVPEEFIFLAVEASEHTGQGIFVSTKPSCLAIGSIKEGTTMPTFSMTKVATMFAMQLLKMFAANVPLYESTSSENEEVNEQPEKPPVSPTKVTVKEAAVEYKTVLAEMQHIADLLSINLPNASRLENVYHLLQTLVNGYLKSKTVH